MVLMLLGCQPRVPTDELSVWLQVHNEGAELSVEVEVLDWEGRPFILRDDDELTLTVGDQVLDLDGGRFSWEGTAPEDEAAISLLLDREWDLRGTVEGRLPAPLALTAPVSGDASFAIASEDLDMAWEPSGTDDSMSYRVDGDCVLLEKAFYGDFGVATIAPWAWPQGALEGCEAELSVIRSPWPGVLQSWSGFATASGESSSRDSVSVRLVAGD